MIGGGIRAVIALLAAVLALAVARPVDAQAFIPGSTCHVGADLGQSYADLASQPERWTCGDSNWSIDKERAILRFDLRGLAAKPPTRLQTRLGMFEAMRLTVIAEDGRSASRLVTTADVRPATYDWLMNVALPRLDGPISAMVVEIDRPRHRGLLSDMRLIEGTSAQPSSLRYELLVAGVCGILLMPLIFNVGFYRVLRERFLFWHAAAVTFMIVQTAVTSGIVNRFADLSIETLCLLSPVSWAAGISTAALFSADLIEEGKLDRRHRLALRLMAPWLLFWSLYYPLAGGALRATAATLYFASFIPVLAIFVWVITVAKLRGSRAVNFQIMAWLPVMITGSIRIVTTVWSGFAPLELQFQQHLAIALEVVITSLGVADRFMLIRTQRDRAQDLARRFEDMAGRDPLTGLLNRRAIEERFHALYLRGFRCMAVIDLDHFKDVNDRHGHATGDRVLCATAAALAADDDTLAVRMGGEEFLLLLRGKDAALRAERRRQSIPIRIAAEVPGLDGLVTASMGMVEHDRSEMLPSEFKHTYAHCDRLLYEAKNTGRNRTLSAFVRHFVGGSRSTEAA